VCHSSRLSIVVGSKFGYVSYHPFPRKKTWAKDKLPAQLWMVDLGTYKTLRKNNAKVMEYKRRWPKTDYSYYLGSFDTNYIIFRNVEIFKQNKKFK